MAKREILIFPWWKIRNDHGHHTREIGEWEFLRFDAREPPESEIPIEAIETVRRILKRYAVGEKQVVRSCMLAKPKDKDWLEPLAEDYHESRIDQVVAFAGLAPRWFFSEWHYCSTELFQADCWTLDGDASGKVFSIPVRRKDVVGLHAFIGQERVIHAPREASGGGGNGWELEWRFGDAVYRGIHAGETWCYDLREAIEHYVLASVDGWPMDSPRELVLLNGAFQRLFLMGPKDKDKAFKSRLVSLFEEGGVIAKERPDLIESVEQWATEFWNVRGRLAHGRSTPGDEARKWSVEQHVLLASFLFPALVASFLKQRRVIAWEHNKYWGFFDLFPSLLLLKDHASLQEDERPAWAAVVEDGLVGR